MSMLKLVLDLELNLMKKYYYHVVEQQLQVLLNILNLLITLRYFFRHLKLVLRYIKILVIYNLYYIYIYKSKNTKYK